VIQSWSVTFGGQTIQGLPEEGYVALSSTDTALHVYFAEKSMGSRRSNSELVEKLYSFCGFDKADEAGMDRSYLLFCIIIEDDIHEINTLLDKHKVPRLPTDVELVDEEERMKKLEAQSSQSKNKINASQTISLSSTASSRLEGTPGKISASYMSIAALAEKILLQQVKVFTVSDEDAVGASNADWIMFSRNTHGNESSSARLSSPAYGLDADITPGPNGVPSVENIQLISLKRSMRNHDLDRLQALGEVFVSLTPPPLFFF